MRILFTFTFILLAWASNAQSIVGKWKTIDDNTGEARSIVEIYKKGDKFHGKILQTIPKAGEDPDPLCDACKGKKKNQRVNGMEIISDMRAKGKEFVGGDILDPESGKVYDCKLWVEDGKLKVRGYLLFFYRTQTWLPAG